MLIFMTAELQIRQDEANSSVTGNEFRVSTLRKAQYPPENFSEQTQGFAGDPRIRRA
jgi:uncharacterized protein (DUF927 family)